MTPNVSIALSVRRTPTSGRCLVWGLAGLLAASLSIVLGWAGLEWMFPSMPSSPTLYDARRDYTQDLPVFPGAEGFGTISRAGRRGQVLRVTSLAAEGPGSLRAALSTPGPRVVVFEVGGIIDITSALVIDQPYVTVAGQTAPDPGITIIGAGLVIITHDVLVQHLRIRVGDRPEGPAPDGRDALAIYCPPDNEEPVHNVVIDHGSFSWAIDECASTWDKGVEDITLRQCIFSEGLSHSLHPKGEHSKGLLIGDHARRVSIIGNLFAHNKMRNPFVKGDVSVLIVNNLVYNPGTDAIHFGDAEGSGPSLGAVIGNVFIPGPDTPDYVPMINLLIDMKPASAIYALDNDPGGHRLWRSGRSRKPFYALDTYEDCPIRVTPLTIRPSRDVRDWIPANAGAYPARRDAIDHRIVSEVVSGTGHIIDSPSEVDGFPQPMPVERVLALPADPDGDADKDGYTNLEEWLHQQAAEVEGAS